MLEVFSRITVHNFVSKEIQYDNLSCPFFVQIGQFQEISICNHGRLPYFNPPLPSEIPKCITPPCPQNSIIVNPPPLQNFRFLLEVHFRLSNANMNKWTWIYASSRLWSSGVRRQGLRFSDQKNLPLVARLCKLLFKSEFGYRNKHHLR